jgi:hypothetical protein
MTRTIDVTGLPEAVVQDVERLVATVRQNLRQEEETGDQDERHSAEAWIKAWRAWVDANKRYAPFVDDSRESIYEGRGE